MDVGAIRDRALQHGLGGCGIRCLEEGVTAVEVDDGDSGHLAQPAEIPVDIELVAVVTVLALQLLARTARPDLAVGDDHQIVAQAFDEVELVAGEQHGGTVGGGISQHPEHGVDAHGIEAGERLVENEHFGLVDESGGDLCALLVAEGQGIDGVVRPRAEFEPLEQTGRACRCITSGHAVQPTEVGDLLGHLHLRVEPTLFRHVPEDSPVIAAERRPAQAHRAGIGRQHAEDDPHRRRLAGTVSPDESGDAAVTDGETHLVERGSIAVCLGHPVYL
jgi:hypothetical protein